MSTKVRIRSPQQLKPGVELRGGYRIVRRIAVGGTAWVFEAKHVPSGRRVAIKVLNDHYRSDPNIVKRFANEARAAMVVDSPHVVKIEEVGRLSGGLAYLVIEYLDGADLYQVLEAAGWRLPVEKALYVVDQVARALEVAHEHDVVHRDIKPENIFLLDTPEGLLVKVVDFGLSKVPRTGSISKLTKTGTTVGTPHYMPLEQLRGEEGIDGRADVYALGVLTFELLSGHCPFEGDDPQEVMLRAARERAPSLSVFRPDLPPGLIAAVTWAMQRRREERCPSARDFREAVWPFWSGDAPTFGRKPSEPTATAKSATPSEPPAPPGSTPPLTSDPPPARPEMVTTPPDTVRTPLPARSPERRGHRPAHRPLATIAAVLLATLVLAVGLTCFIVDTVRGTPGSSAYASLPL